MILNRTHVSFPITDFQRTKQQMLNWAGQFNICCFLDNHAYHLPHHSHDCLLAAGALEFLEAHAGNAFNKLRHFSNEHKDWLFGHFSFDLKNETEQVSSGHPDHIGFPDLFFFVPEVVIELKKDTISIGIRGHDHERILEQILHYSPGVSGAQKIQPIMERFSRQEYISTVEELRRHILYGDCYEINFCQEFYAEDTTIDPLRIYNLLSNASPMPFGAFYKLRDKYLLCASPERYLKKEGRVLISQPIKGTEQRIHDDPILDNLYKEKLFHSGKDRAENIMVVDLVRNDLSKICEEGSISVEELYGIYSFPQVHQMISSVSGRLPAQTHWVDAIKATFPMGSMTGAPKKRVLELIEQYEKTKRGLFSGTLGYITPDEDFDFNVVIRSILYNDTTHYLSYQAGSAITFYSDAMMEYEECVLKASAIRKVLGDVG